MESLTSRLNDYLYKLEDRTELGLLVLQNRTTVDWVTDFLEVHGYREARSARTLLWYLQGNESVYLILRQEFCHELQDIILQYHKGDGRIDFMDHAALRLRSIRFDPTRAHLVVIVLAEQLEQIKKSYFTNGDIRLVQQI